MSLYKCIYFSLHLDPAPPAAASPPAAPSFFSPLTARISNSCQTPRATARFSSLCILPWSSVGYGMCIGFVDHLFAQSDGDAVAFVTDERGRGRSSAWC